jgi:hypothetical protein
MKLPRKSLAASLLFSCLAAAAMSLQGCGGVGQGSKQMVADYHGLDDKSLAIVVFTAQANTDEFPGARKDISNFVANKLRLHMPTTRLMNFDEIIQWQDDTINWFGLSEKDIGKHFSVDRVLYIEVLAYEARSDNSYGDLQGHLRANCKIFETDTPGNSPAWSAVIDATWPKSKPVAASETNEITVRTRTLDRFAEELVRHFYDHQKEDVPLHNRM